MTGIHQRFIYILVGANIALHTGDIPLWVLISSLLFVVWRWLIDLLRLSQPGQLVLGIFVVGSILGLWFEFNQLIGDQVSICMLIIMVALKAFSIRGYRDVMAVTYLCLFLLMAKLLSSQSMTMTVILFIDVFAILSLMHLYHVPVKNDSFPWGKSWRLILTSVPVVLVLFVLFPRYNFSLFKNQQRSTQRVGFNPDIKPGGMMQLMQSDEIAFRAFFVMGNRPAQDQLYWRGAVLTKGDGLAWKLDETLPASRRPVLTNSEYKVQIMSESAGEKWLFTLNWPQEITWNSPSRALDMQRAYDYTYQLKLPLVAKETYEVAYNPLLAKQDISRTERIKLTEIAPPSEKIRELLARLTAQGKAVDIIVDALERYYREEKFVYSLKPPPTETVEEFLFSAKSGFCEHYSSATASLFRWLGIPARVVVGYQGGSVSLLGDYNIIMQRDAHAWMEYWDDRVSKWLRLDPTAWVAAERIALGGQAYYERNMNADLGASERSWVANMFGFKAWRWLVRSRLYVDQFEVWWASFLLHYDFTYQKTWLAKLGLVGAVRLKLWFLTIGSVLLLFFVGYIWQKHRHSWRTDKTLRVYRLLCEKLARLGLPRQINEGPLNYLNRVVASYPQSELILTQIFYACIEWRYNSRNPSASEFRQLKTSIKKLKLTK